MSAQYRQPSVKLSSPVLGRYMASPVVVCWSVSPLAALACSHSTGSPMTASPSVSWSWAKPRTNVAGWPEAQYGPAAAVGGAVSAALGLAITLPAVFGVALAAPGLKPTSGTGAGLA